MTKIPHYYSQEEGDWLPLIPKATTEDFGRVKLVDQISENPEDSNSSVAVTPKAISDVNASLKNTLTTAYGEADANLKKDLEAAYKKADDDLDTKITNASYKAADGTLRTEITGAYEAADGALKTEIKGAYEAADANIEVAYKKADEDLKTEITNGTIVAKKAEMLEGIKNIEGPVILNFKDGKPVSYTDDTNIGNSSQPIYFDAETGKFKVCDTSLHPTNKPTKANKDQTLSGNSSVSIVSSIDWNDSGHIDELTCGNLSLGAAGENLGGIKTGGDLSLTDGVGSVTNLNLSSVKVNNSTTESLQTVFDTALKKSGDTFTGNLIGDKSKIIFTGDPTGLFWRLRDSEYSLLNVEPIQTLNENGESVSTYGSRLGDTNLETNIRGSSLHLQSSIGGFYLSGAQGDILNDTNGINLGNTNSSLSLLSNDKGIHTDYPVKMHAARYHLHAGLGEGTLSYTKGVPITNTTAGAEREGACLPLELYSATSSFMSESGLFQRVYYWGDGADTDAIGYDLSENALIAKHAASLLVSGTIYVNNLEPGSSIGGQLVYSTNGGESLAIIAGRQEVRLPATATNGHVILPPTVVKVAKNSRLGLRCYTYTKSGYVPTHSSDGANITGRTHLDIVCLGLNDNSVQMEPLT